MQVLLHGGATAGRDGAAPAEGEGGGGRIQQLMIRRFDKNGNGKLDPDEEEEARQALRQLGGGAGGERGAAPNRQPDTKPAGK